jgi:hypothetical protein
MKTASATADFDQRYQTHLKHLKLKGLQPKTIDAHRAGSLRLTGLVQQTIQIVASHDLTLLVIPFLNHLCLGAKPQTVL